MKQHIDKTQFNELSEGGKHRFKDWIVTKKYVRDDKFMVIPDYCPSIGQMIEFLDINNINCCLVDHIGDSPGQPHWSVQLFNGGYGKLHVELCDCLWEAVKEVLECGGNE